ncbi:MAG: chromosome segregation protein, partial [Patescibacteria group bacterium]|nr:chromosome segregation protein [Patescibacteria group bacterium]
SAHIGASGHHIISQGEADRILNASITERKAMIEDALGLKMYQYKKQESEKKLAKTRENIGQVESLRREITPHIRFLKKQVEKVQKTLELKDELKEKALEYCNREQEYIQRMEVRIDTDKKPLVHKASVLEQELHEAKSVLEKASHKDASSEELIQLEKNLHDIRNEKDNLFRQFGQLDGEIASLIRMMKKQEEVAHSYVHKTVTLVSVEEIYNSVQQKLQSARDLRDINALLSVLEEIDTIWRGFIDNNKDKVDLSLMADVQNDISELKKTKENIEDKLAHVKKQETDLSERYGALQNEIEKEKDSNRDAEKAIFRIMAEQQEVRSALNTLRADEEHLRLLQEDFKRELTELGMMLGTSITQYNSLSFDHTEERAMQEERRRAIEKIKIRLEDAGGIGGADVMKEYTDATERDEFLAKELADLEQSANSLTELITDLDSRLSTEFTLGVDKINHQFKEYFALMFGGGEAYLTVVAPPKRKRKDTDMDGLLADGEEGVMVEEQETQEGIEIEVNLPKKKVKGLMMLSGGERALTSIALLFAISQVNPPPFIILDETDAALDEANSKKYADMVENLSHRSQLIVITHNRETMSRAGILYGVTMGLGGGSKLLSVAFDEAVAVAK